ncbi:hypothetical protein MAR_033156 [Mya arenaria]|uniref:Uncharacterized protein n=1 Tax=Mya arenaria TaxID=6604 RepID=A0ABY7GAM8_MYAAR|nr:hypothetical protein MAR_033156 [Mya arenaria]
MSGIVLRAECNYIAKGSHRRVVRLFIHWTRTPAFIISYVHFRIQTSATVTRLLWISQKQSVAMSTTDKRLHDSSCVPSPRPA